MISDQNALAACSGTEIRKACMAWPERRGGKAVEEKRSESLKVEGLKVEETRSFRVGLVRRRCYDFQTLGLSDF